MLRRSSTVALAVLAACHMPTDSFHEGNGAGGGAGGDLDAAVGQTGRDAGDPTSCSHVGFSLAPAPLFSGAMLPSIAVADLDGDPRTSPDLVVTSAPDGTPGTLSVLLNDGRGAFPADKRTDYAAGGGPQGVLAADLDAKGHLDLVVVNSGENTVGVFLNKGGTGGSAGAFQPMMPYQAKGNPSSVGVGNFDANAGLDLAVTDKNVGGYVSILPNAGNGTFPVHHDIPTAADGTPWAVAVTNVDGGGLDLVVANHALRSANVLIGNGNGDFTTQPADPVGVQPTSVAVGTLRSGGKPYIFVANSGDGTVSVLQYIDGSLSPVSGPLVLAGKSPQAIAVKDLNHDAKLDLVIANGDNPGSVSVVLGNGDGTFQSPAFVMTGGVKPRSVAVDDIDGDGLPDIVVAHESGTVSLLVAHCMP